MKQRTRNLLLGLILSVVLIFTLINPNNINQSSAASVPYVTYTGDNIEDQDYRTWSKPIYSYISKYSDNQIMTVQYISGDKFVVEYFDSDYKFLSYKEITLELPKFGGFYETDSNYYILTGQNNPNEDDNVEVYRITKYDKNWNRIASCGLYGANTYAPFEAGSAHMTSSGKYLFIRTCHKMYVSSDGLNHQANVTIQIDMDTMTVTDSYTGVMNVSWGYVSHSFNEFIQIENNKVVAVDHGDAFPRSIVLINYSEDVTTGQFLGSNFAPCTSTNMVSFSGEAGANYTGASLGGFEISSSAYLVAGNQDIGTSKYDTRNIFVAAKNKSSGAVTVNKITDYAAGSGETTTPHFVKIAEDSFMLLWNYNGKVYYTRIDAEGRQVGNIYNVDGDLSDCVPTMIGNNLVWYVWENEYMYFYNINISSLDNPSVKKVKIGYTKMHRLYNPNSGEHFYTADETECDNLIGFGWRYEGIAWNAPETSDTLVYRLYNPNAGDHHYTTSLAEKDNLVSVGWKYEGIGWYSAESDGQALYRLYNPNATGAGSHHYTTSADERDNLISLGWRDEGIAWYGGK